jgi:hypothetical protein
VVVAENATEPGAATDDSNAVVIGGDLGRTRDSAFEPLVKSLGLVAYDELPDQVPKMALAEDDEVVQTFVPEGPNEALRERIAVRGAPAQTGEMPWRKKPYEEGLANHFGPESCVGLPARTATKR